MWSDPVSFLPSEPSGGEKYNFNTAFYARSALGVEKQRE